MLCAHEAYSDHEALRKLPPEVLLANCAVTLARPSRLRKSNQSNEATSRMSWQDASPLLLQLPPFP